MTRMVSQVASLKSRLNVVSQRLQRIQVSVKVITSHVLCAVCVRVGVHYMHEPCIAALIAPWHNQNTLTHYAYTDEAMRDAHADASCVFLARLQAKLESQGRNR